MQGLTSLIPSRRVYHERGKQTHTFLRLLGVSFRQVEDQSFWDANHHHLPEIFEAMQDEARDRIRELHPDRDGDPAEFRAFIEDLRRTQDSFRRRLPRAESTSRPLTIGRHRNPARILTVLRLAKEGKSGRKIATELGMCGSGVCKIVRRYAPETLCKCGRAWSHRGCCKARDDRAWFKQLPEESLAKMRLACKGKPKSLEHRQKIADALRGKKKSAEHIFRSVRGKSLRRPT